MSSFRTIVLKGDPRYDEAVPAAAFTPGHLLEWTSVGKVQKHSVRGGWAERLFATEDRLQGKVITDAYDTSGQAGLAHCRPGDEIQCILTDGETSVIGTRLMSNGDGTLRVVDFNMGQVLYVATAASGAHIADGTEEAFDNATYTFPANTLKVGDIIRVRAQGICLDQNGADTLIITLRIDGDDVGEVASWTPADNDIFYFECDLVIRTIGAAGTFVAAGASIGGVPDTAALEPFLTASTAIDTTGTLLLDLTHDYSAAHAENLARLDVFDVQLLRDNGPSPIAVSMEAITASGVTHHRVRVI